MWIIHKGDRKTLHNTESYDLIRVVGDKIEMTKLDYPDKAEVLFYESAEEANAALVYLVEAMKRKDALVHI